MAKKRKAVELSEQEITCNIENRSYKLLRFHPSSMSVDMKEIGENAQKGVVSIAFAHLPKSVKKILKPK